MATKKKETKATVVTSATQLIAGVTKRFATGTQVSFAGGSYTPAQITSKLQSLVTLRTDVDTAKASTKARRTGARDAEGRREDGRSGRLRAPTVGKDSHFFW